MNAQMIRVISSPSISTTGLTTLILLMAGRLGACGRVTSPPMDFDWTPEQQALRAQAREVAADAVARFGRHNDSWINGYSDEFAKEMAALGWIGLTWPTEFGGGGRPPIDRLIIGEELIAAGAPIAAMWFADRQMGPALIAFGRPDQQAEFLPGHPRRRDDVVHRDVRARGRQRPGRPADVGPPRRRRVGHQRPEDLDQLRRRRRLLLPDLPHVDRRPAARRASARSSSRWTRPGIEVRPITDMTTNRHFCEVFFTDVRVPVANLVGVEGNAFKQTMRQLEHERGGIDRLVSNHALYRLAAERADTADPLVRQEIAALETGYRIGRILVIREVLRQAPAGLLGGHEVLLHRARVAASPSSSPACSAPRRRCGTTSPQGLVYAPGYTIMGGTSNVMRNILGERVLGLPREPR